MPPVTRQIKAIIFDFGGVVLVDWNPHYLYRSFLPNDDAIDNFLSEIGFVEWNQEQDRGRSFAEGVADLTARYPHHSDLIRAYDERWEESIGGPIQPTVEILRELKQAGYALYGLSNWSAETFQRVREKFQFFGWFETIVLSGDVRLIKPDPQIYRLVLEKTNLSAEECLFIDDSATNIEAANRLGFKTIRFVSPEQLAAELAQLKILPQAQKRSK